MGCYKHIEQAVGAYIAPRYRRAVEIGVGMNPDAALILRDSGVLVLCTDIRQNLRHDDLEVVTDDIFEPDVRLYAGADLLYAIRPGVEMVPPMIRLARQIDSDLIVYHLGHEIYGDGGEILDCGVVLHRYHRRSGSEEG
jgi:uncharacterized protein